MCWRGGRRGRGKGRRDRELKDKSIERAAKVYLYRIIISKHHRSYAARALCFTNSTNPSIGRWNRDRRIRSEGHKEKINVFVVTRSPLFPSPIFETLIPKTRLQNQDPRFRVPDPASPFTLTFPSSLLRTLTNQTHIHQTPKKTQKQSADPSIPSRRTHPPSSPFWEIRSSKWKEQRYKLHIGVNEIGLSL